MLPVNYFLRLSTSTVNFEMQSRRVISTINPDAVVLESGLLHDRLAGTVRDRSFTTLLLALFVVAGLGITATGIFGVVSFVVARRTREIAIRRAIGAQSQDVLWLIIRNTMKAAVLGVATGFVIGTWISHVLESQLYGVTSTDAISLAAAGTIMLVLVSIASWLPARRATALSPSEALRVD
jgi:ABC-type antimicrobial peptide transport system permease subunit